MNSVDVRLYLVTSSEGLSEAEFLKKVESACRGGVTLVQLREKERTAREYLSLARKVKEITDRYRIPLMIDDRVDIALAAGASGVHLGQNDLPVLEARKILGREKIIGATAKTVEQAKEAEAQGADYLGVGAIFPTTTKVITVITKVSTLKEIKAAVKIPVCAIGGLNAGNISILKGSGADGAAAVTALMKADDPEFAARELLGKIAEL